MGFGKYLLKVALVFGVMMVGLIACNGDETTTPAPPQPTPNIQPDIGVQVQEALPSNTLVPSTTPVPTPVAIALSTKVPIISTVPTPDPIPTPTPVPTPAPSPTPTPTPQPEAHLAVALEPTGGEPVNGTEWRIDFTITNRSQIPAFEVLLYLNANGQGRVEATHLARGDCVGSICRVSSFDGNESVTGHVVVVPETGFDRRLRVDADVSWELSNSRRRHSYGEAAARVVDGGRPGDLIWLTSTEANGDSCGERTQVGPEAVYAGFSGKLHAVSRDNGEVLWVHDTDDAIFDPYLADGNIYYSSRREETPDEGRRYFIRGLNAKTGEQTWEREIPGYARGPGVLYGDSIFFTVSVPETADNPWYHYLVSLEASTGIMNWRYRVDKNVNTPAMEYDGSIYFSTYGSAYDFLYAIDPHSGELRKQYEPPRNIYSAPLLENGTVYAISALTPVWAFDLTEGTEKWAYWPEGKHSTTPVMYDGNVYIAIWDEGRRDYLSVDTLDAETGKLKWSYQPGERVTLPTAAGGSVYIASATRLVSLDAETGNVNWEGDYAYLCSPPTVVDGVLYGRARTGNNYVIYAIRGE